MVVVRFVVGVLDLATGDAGAGLGVLLSDIGDDPGESVELFLGASVGRLDEIALDDREPIRLGQPLQRQRPAVGATRWLIPF